MMEQHEEIATEKKLTIYINTKCKHQIFVQNSCSCGGLESYKDHKLVKAAINFKLWRKQKTTISKPKIDIRKLENTTKKNRIPVNSDTKPANKNKTRSHTITVGSHHHIMPICW